MEYYYEGHETFHWIYQIAREHDYWDFNLNIIAQACIAALHHRDQPLGVAWAVEVVLHHDPSEQTSPLVNDRRVIIEKITQVLYTRCSQILQSAGFYDDAGYHSIQSINVDGTDIYLRQ